MIHYIRFIFLVLSMSFTFHVSASEPCPLTSAKKYKILVVDDEAHVLESQTQLVERAMREIGAHEIITAVNGLDALEKIKNNSDINLVISDWHMPFMDGAELSIQVTKMNIPIILVTSDPYNLADTLAKRNALGAPILLKTDAFWSLPLEIQYLFAK